MIAYRFSQNGRRIMYITTIAMYIINPRVALFFLHKRLSEVF